MSKAVAYKDTPNRSHPEGASFLANLLEEIEESVREERESVVLHQSATKVISLPRPRPQPHRLYSYD
jgi:hypothetical protein